MMLLSCGIFLGPQPFREKRSNSFAVLPHQPLQVQHARTFLLLVPWGPEPPIHLAARLQAKLGQSQQTHGHPLRLAGPLDRVLGPGPALLPTQSLFQVPKAVFLPKPCREQLEQFKAAQRHGRADYREPLGVTLHFGHHGLDRHFVPQDAPEANHLLPLNLALPPVEKHGPHVPLSGPPAPLAGWRELLAPLRLRPSLSLGLLLWRQCEEPSVVP